MTIVAVDRTPATGMGADPKSLRDDAEYLIIGFIEAARLVGLRLASYEAGPRACARSWRSAASSA
jgi:hypothetical protein